MLVLACDLGTTGNKTCLFRVEETVRLVDSQLEGYPLLMTEGGGAEQRADDWWSAICRSTRAVLGRSGTDPREIKGMAFCCQMQGSILVDRQGSALRNPMIYMDERAIGQQQRYLAHGLFRISGYNAFKLLRSLQVTGGLAATPKDPLWKYHWVRENEPAVFERAFKWLDVKDYLLLRCTGRYGMTPDSAHITFIYDTRPGRAGWHAGLCRTYDVKMEHLPQVVESTAVVGELTGQAASEMGLVPGIPVFGGGGDVSMIALGSGCVDLYDTHVYVGTSGWVVSSVDRRMVDIGNFMASILGAIPGRYNYVAEQDTSGICLQWARDSLLGDRPAEGDEDAAGEQGGDRYQLVNDLVARSEPGAGGVIFTPWLHGNRSPREDAYARGVFFNLGMQSGKPELLRAVMEGVACHKRWMLEAMEEKIPRRDSLRFVGGGARSPLWCQIMADVSGREVQTIESPQNAGAMGAAVVCGVGLGRLGSFAEAKRLIPVQKSYHPRRQFQSVYDRNFEAFKALYADNKQLFRKMNS